MSTKKEKILAQEGLSEPDLVFGIDKNILDEEWLNQPKLYFTWAVQLEDAKNAFEETKQEFDVTQAEVELEIRDKPTQFNLPEKTTEKMIATALMLTKEYQTGQSSVNKARHRVGIIQAAVTALDHRKRALEKLVDLHGQKYFATPRASEHSKEAVSDIEKRAARVKAKISKKRRPE